MGATDDLWASQITDDDLTEIITWKESCHPRPAWKDVSKQTDQDLLESMVPFVTT